MPNKPYFVWLLIICAVVFLVSLPRGLGGTQVQELDIRKLMGAAENDSLVSISIRNDPAAGKDWYVIDGKIKNPMFGKEGADAKAPLPFSFSGRVTDDMYKKLSDPASPWDIKEVPASTFWGNLLMSVLPFVLIFGLIYFIFMRQMRASGKSAMNFGKSRARLLTPDKDRVTFDDVAGCDESKEEVSEVVEFLKNPQRFKDIGARIPKGILMVGPPGTGKTLLARAVAGEADVPFFSISGSDFVEMFVGVGAARVRDMFEQARKSAPCLVFIDEIDAVGRQRGAGLGGGNDEREQTLNSLLVEMDGFDAHSGIIIIAATNRPDILDPALLRPGRFDRQVTVNYPDTKGRVAILKVHAKGKPIAPDVDFESIAHATVGFTGADLENLLNEAALLAARTGKKAITMAEIDEAALKVEVGSEKKSHKMNEKAKRLTAYHEAGHAVSNFYLDHVDPVHQISIIPRGMAGGYTLHRPTEDKNYTSKNEMLDSLVGLLGGRVAEALVIGDVSTGASNDIERATEIARSMVTKYGMSDKLGPIAFGDQSNEVFLGKDFNHVRNYSESVASQIDEEIERIVKDAYSRTKEILSEHIDKLHAVAQALLKEEKIDGKEFEAIMKGEQQPAEAEPQPETAPEAAE